jgi:hypothetical protein
VLGALLVDVFDRLILQTVLANENVESLYLTSDLGTNETTVIN